MPKEPVALVVNAGGQSRRMGRIKALLPAPPDNLPLVTYIVRRLITLVSDVSLVVCNDPQVAQAVATEEGVEVLSDRWPDAGALGGVATGLARCRGWAMVVACDMPLVDPSIYAQLIAAAQKRPQVDAMIPLIAGQPQPFHGLWHRRALAVLEAQIAAGELALHSALAKLNVVWMDEVALALDPANMAFYNVNTLEEWEKVLAILSQQKSTRKHLASRWTNAI